MYRKFVASCLKLVFSLTCLAILVQVLPLHTPLSSDSPSYHSEQPWDLNVPLPANSTGHLIFNTASSLLQQWPNTRYRHGHTIVPGTVPVGTLLYHGRSDPHFPTTPDWTATDPEHSFPFCMGSCWHLTLVTTRPLKVLYFDGASGVKMQGGPMDSQDVVVWGELRPEKVFDEEERLEKLCDWGNEFGLDGFVRMEMDFEIMLCDFTSGVETVSFLNLAHSARGGPTPQGADEPPPPPPGVDVPPNPAVTVRNFELVHSSSQHNNPGDLRIRLDLSRLVSFYDVELVPSLVSVRRSEQGVNIKRWEHRLEGITEGDVVAVRKRLSEVLRDKGYLRSGVDWETLMRVIVDRYGSRLETLRYILESEPGTGTVGSDKERMAKAQLQLTIMLTPYIPSSVFAPNSTFAQNDDGGHSWATPVFRHCSTSHTSYIASSSMTGFLTRSERLLLGGVQETTREICRVLVRMWSEGKIADLGTGTSEVRSEDLIEKWKADLSVLMEWLDWSTWVKCRPACGVEEMCYLPTWPYFGGPPPGPAHGDFKASSRGEIKPHGENEWDNPQPRCIRRIEPYSF